MIRNTPPKKENLLSQASFTNSIRLKVVSSVKLRAIYHSQKIVWRLHIFISTFSIIIYCFKLLHLLYFPMLCLIDPGQYYFSMKTYLLFFIYLLYGTCFSLHQRKDSQGIIVQGRTVKRFLIPVDCIKKSSWQPE